MYQCNHSLYQNVYAIPISPVSRYGHQRQAPNTLLSARFTVQIAITTRREIKDPTRKETLVNAWGNQRPNALISCHCARSGNVMWAGNPVVQWRYRRREKTSHANCTVPNCPIAPRQRETRRILHQATAKWHGCVFTQWTRAVAPLHHCTTVIGAAAITLPNRETWGPQCHCASHSATLPPSHPKMATPPLQICSETPHNTVGQNRGPTPCHKA